MILEIEDHTIFGIKITKKHDPKNEDQKNAQDQNGAARLDPWENFILLPLKIPFHFISLRKLENYLQFYMTIAFKLNRTKKKVHHKFEIAFNFKKEIPLKCFLSPLGILYPLGG